MSHKQLQLRIQDPKLHKVRITLTGFFEGYLICSINKRHTNLNIIMKLSVV